MASHESMMKKRDQILGRLNAALGSLMKRRGSEYTRVPTFSKEGPDALVLTQLDHVARAAEQLVGFDALNPETVTALEGEPLFAELVIEEDNSLVSLVEGLARDAGVSFDTPDYDDPEVDVGGHLARLLRQISEVRGLNTSSQDDADAPKNPEDPRAPVDTALPTADSDAEADTEPVERRAASDLSDIVGDEQEVKRVSRAAADEAVDASTARRPKPPSARK